MTEEHLRGILSQLMKREPLFHRRECGDQDEFEFARWKMRYLQLREIAPSSPGSADGRHQEKKHGAYRDPAAFRIEVPAPTSTTT